MSTIDRKLLDEVRDVMRLRHYSIHTERSYCAWIRKFVHFHNMKSRDDLADGEKNIESFLTHLAVHLNHHDLYSCSSARRAGGSESFG